MNGMTIAGLDVVVIGGMLWHDYKALGMTSPAVSLVIVAAGVLIALLGSRCRIEDRRSASATSPG